MSLFDTKLNSLLHFRFGKNAQDNWDLIDDSKPNDIWFHLQDTSSCHVILSLPEGTTVQDISKQTLIHCAMECKKRSKRRNIGSVVVVIFTEISNITKGGQPGSVQATSTRKLHLK
jgi:predicted ribosome quality control (RQC) complex YloA/Tae2 family protein